MNFKALFPAAKSIGVGVLSFMPSAVDSYQSKALEVAGESTGSSAPVQSASLVTSSISNVSLSHRADRIWSGSKERQFTDLATLKALKTASSSDMQRFYELQAERRQLKNPMSSVEMIFQFKKRQMESRLLAQIAEYTDFTQCRESQG